GIPWALERGLATIARRTVLGARSGVRGRWPRALFRGGRAHDAVRFSPVRRGGGSPFPLGVPSEGTHDAKEGPRYCRFRGRRLAPGKEQRRYHPSLARSAFCSDGAQELINASHSDQHDTERHSDPMNPTPSPSFSGLLVVTFESRLSGPIADLITKY